MIVCYVYRVSQLRLPSIVMPDGLDIYIPLGSIVTSHALYTTTYG